MDGRDETLSVSFVGGYFWVMGSIRESLGRRMFPHRGFALN